MDEGANEADWLVDTILEADRGGRCESHRKRVVLFGMQKMRITIGIAWS
jgi:hypothetical protein